ncbi:hypothetical protein TrLO_g6351 [Triparma laevis f. longispina]|uniref:Glutathione S-transferase n=1 Tax=Triparma laevis f. longispina TaxID=1714387 RepID=A0A9W7F4S5_9STRA|nr:hypothetical protein TrLO_g6351 [Triparma laevis f. longispina]
MQLLLYLLLGIACLPITGAVPTFYTSATCPYAQRTSFLLNILVVPHNTVLIDLKDKPASFLEVNPHGKVPSFKTDQNECLYESLLLNEYLCEMYSSNLLPSNPIVRFKIRLAQNNFETLMKTFFKVFVAEDGDLNELNSSLSTFNDSLTSGYICGDCLTLADVNCAPFFHRLIIGYKVKGYDVLGKWKNVKDWWERIEETTEWKNCRLEDDRVEEGLIRMKEMMIKK